MIQVALKMYKYLCDEVSDILQWSIRHGSFLFWTVESDVVHSHFGQFKQNQVSANAAINLLINKKYCKVTCAAVALYACSSIEEWHQALCSSFKQVYERVMTVAAASTKPLCCRDPGEMVSPSTTGCKRF